MSLIVFMSWTVFWLQPDIIGCTLLIFVALGVAVIGSRWANSDRMEQALRLNAVARWAYVGLFALVVTIAIAM